MKNESENARLERLLNMRQNQPNDVFLLYALALEWMKRGDSEQAIDALQRVIELDPGYLAAYFQLGHLLLDQLQKEVAIGIFEKGIVKAHEAKDLKTLAELKNALLNAQIDD
jgi:tetratricopeptide (TPR) repeat protein